MRTVHAWLALFTSLAALGACADSPTNDSTPLDGSGTRVSVFITDAPGDVRAVWVDVSEVYFQGGPGGRTPLVTEATGLIELTALVDRARELATDVAIEPGSYSQLRFVIASAVLETLDGAVYAFGGAVHPEGLDVTGELKCPGCSSSGLKVKLPNGQVSLEEGENGLVLDFDVSQSFGRMAGNSGKWQMSPVIHASKLDGDDPDDPTASSRIEGSVQLGSNISIPACPAGEPRSLEDFVPIATAVSLVDEDGAVIVRSGETDEDGSFAIGYVEPDGYAMGFEPEIAFGDDRLVFEASVDPEQVTVEEGKSVSGVVYTLTSASCVMGTSADPTSPKARVDIFITDAPGQVKAAWVDVASVYFQGGPAAAGSGKVMLLEEPTGLIEITALVTTAQELVGGLELAPGRYNQLRFVIASAVLETLAGEVFSFGGAEHPDGLETTGELKCPGCSSSGLKVKLPKGELDLEAGQSALVLDFDVSQSFGEEKGKGNGNGKGNGKGKGSAKKWVMSPVIHAAHSKSDDDGEDDDDDDPTVGGTIGGVVALVPDESGNPIVLPQCPAGEAIGLGAFVPTAMALTLTDEDGESITRTGSVDAEGSFAIDYLSADDYGMGFMPTVELGDHQLVWDANVEPAQVTLADGQAVEGVAYAISGATCEAVAPTG